MKRRKTKRPRGKTSPLRHKCKGRHDPREIAAALKFTAQMERLIRSKVQTVVVLGGPQRVH